MVTQLGHRHENQPMRFEYTKHFLCQPMDLGEQGVVNHLDREHGIETSVGKRQAFKNIALAEMR